MQPERITELLRLKLESSGFFGAHFRESAGRALLLPRRNFQERMPLWLNRLRSKKLMAAVIDFKDFPVLLETWRHCLQHEFDLENLKTLLVELQEGVIEYTETTTTAPAPFSDGIIWRQTDLYMYAGDTPHSKQVSNLDEELLNEVIQASHLRPAIPAHLIADLEAKLQRRLPDYVPSPDETIDWIGERLLLPELEWRELLELTAQSHESEYKPDFYMGGKLVAIRFPGANTDSILTLDNLPRLLPFLEEQKRNADGLIAALAPHDPFSGEEITEIAAARLERLLEIQDAKKVERGLEESGDELEIFLVEFLRFYGPLNLDFLKNIFGTPGVRDRGLILESLADQGQVLLDDIMILESNGDTRRARFCDRENMEILLRMTRRAARPERETLPAESLSLFFAVFQGLTNPGDRLEDLQEVMERFFGYPARAHLFEKEFLPARLEPYFSAWLDRLFLDSDLIWAGAGKENIYFSFAPDLELFPYVLKKDTEREDATESLREAFINRPGRYSFNELMELSGLNSESLSESLWNLAWEGFLSNTEWEALRKGIMNKFKSLPLTKTMQGGRRSGLSRWKNSRPFSGSWFGLNLSGESEENDALLEQELVKDRVRQLLNRYGLLFREILQKELPALRWSSVFRALRLMELSGEISGGYFFKGINGLQFCSRKALAILEKGLPEESVYWMNALDPASLCGLGLEALSEILPHRKEGNHLVFRGNKLILVSRKNGKELDIHVPPEDPHLNECLVFFKTLLGREFQPLKNITVDNINGESVLKSPYGEALRNFGFKKDYRNLVLRKQYE